MYIKSQLYVLIQDSSPLKEIPHSLSDPWQHAKPIKVASVPCLIEVMNWCHKWCHN